MPLGQLPEGWSVERFDNLFAIRQGKQVSKATRDGPDIRPFLRTKNIEWGRIDATELDSMNFSDKERKRLALEEGDLLICEGGDIGRTAIWRNEAPDCYYQNHLHRARAVDVTSADPEFFAYWLQYAFAVGQLYFGRGNDTTIANLSKSLLGELPVPHPPIEDQRAIAAALRRTRASIAAHQEQAAAARELRDALRERLFGSIPDDGADDAVWSEATLEELALSIDYGTSQKCSIGGSGHPVLRIPNVVDGRIDLGDVKYGRPTDNELDKVRLVPGDLLFVRTNGVRENAGRCALYRSELDDAYFASYLIRVRVDETRLLPAFLNEYAMSIRGRSFLAGQAVRTADGKYNINSGTLRRVVVPVPSLARQEQIVGALDAVESLARNHEEQAELRDELFRSLMHRLLTDGLPRGDE
jgi:type I restriction enzyme S subunit